MPRSYATTSSPSGGGGSPGGSTPELQFNNSGFFAGADIDYTEPSGTERKLKPRDPAVPEDAGKDFILEATASSPVFNPDTIEFSARAEGQDVNVSTISVSLD